MRHDPRCNAILLGNFQSWGFGPVADNRRYPAGQVGFQQCAHVTAVAGNQNNDGLYRYVSMMVPLEQLGCAPGESVNHGGDVGRQYTRYIFQQTAASDVCHAFIRRVCISASNGFT